MAVGATRLFDLGIGDDGIVNDFIGIGSGLIFSDSLTIPNHLLDFVVRYVGSMPMDDGISRRHSLSPEFIVSGVRLRMGTIPI